MEQFDITEFARMFDAALASDNPSVQKALRNFMMVAAIVHAQDEDERSMGPLETLVKKVDDLERIVIDMKNHRSVRDQYKDYYNNTWMYQQPTTSVSTTSSKTWTDTLGFTAQEISELMKDIKFDENKSD